MATTDWIKSTLTEHRVPYEELHHRVAFTAQEVAQSEHISGHHVAKVVIVLVDDRPVQLVLPASRRVALSQVAKLLGAAAVRLASEMEISQIFTECEPGAVPPLRHWNTVPLIMDASMATRGDIAFQAGTHEAVIRLNFRDWFRLVAPLLGWFTEPEQSARHDSGSAQKSAEGAEWAASSAILAEEARRQSGLPGGGKKRVEVVKPSGVYPASGPFPEGNAAVRAPGQFVHGQFDDHGREVEGGSGLTYLGKSVLLGGRNEPTTRPDVERRERSMKAREVMAQPPVTVCRESSLAEVARTMVDHKAGCVVVVDRNGKLCGIITQSDFADKQQGLPYSMELLLQMFTQATAPETTERARRSAQTTTADDVMQTEVITAAEDSPLEELARLMLRYDVDHIPIVGDGKPVGMVARHDFLRLIAAEPRIHDQRPL